MKKLLLALSAIALLSGCGGGNGSGGGGLSHNQLAEQFVSALNASGVYYVSLVKKDTLQYDYIVIYDADYNEYDAVYIGNYVPGMDVLDFMSRTTIYYNLQFQPGYYDYVPFDYYDAFCGCWLIDYTLVWVEDTYRDPFTGITFEKANEASKDAALYAAIAEESVVSRRAGKVAETYGLSVDRSKEVVRLSMAWQRNGGKDMTDADQDSYSNELLGFSITEAKSALKRKAEGDVTAIDELIEKAAQTNETTPEHIRDLIESNIKQ